MNNTQFSGTTNETFPPLLKYYSCLALIFYCFLSNLFSYFSKIRDLWENHTENKEAKIFCFCFPVTFKKRIELNNKVILPIDGIPHWVWAFDRTCLHLTRAS